MVKAQSSWHRRPMGIPIEIFGEDIDWPAWAQAVGSVVAIGAAIWIDQGAARRALQQETRSRAAAVADWEACLGQVVELVGNAAQLVGSELTDELDDSIVARLVDNAIMMLDAYLRQPPPNPKLAFVLSAARSFCERPRDAIRRRRSADPKFLKRSYSTRLELVGEIQSSLNSAARELDELRTEYHLGIL